VLPDTELICNMSSGMTLCDAGWWHSVFVAQGVLVLSLALTSVMTGLRHVVGRLDTPLWLARRFTMGTLLATAVPLATGLFLVEKVRHASLACYLEHATSGCTHGLMDRHDEMSQVMTWVGWNELLLLGASTIALVLLYVPRRSGVR